MRVANCVQGSSVFAIKPPCSSISTDDRDRADRVPAAKPQRNQWSRGESNPRPLECDSSALPTELRPHRQEEPEQSRAYSSPAPARQPVFRARAQGELAPRTPTVVACTQALRVAR